jgi:AraC-like DNA-binding protein
MLTRFTPPETNFRLFLMDKNISRTEDRDEPEARVPVWRRPQSRPHRHQDLGLILVIRGAMRFRWWDFGGEEHLGEVAAGQVCAMPGTVLHIVEVEQQAVVRGLWLHPTLFRDLEPLGLHERLLDPERAPKPHRTGDGAIFSALHEVWGQAQAELGREAIHKQEVLRALARLAALHFLRLREAHPPSSSSASVQRVQEVRAWLDRHYLEDSTLPQLASRAGLAVSRFSELFRRETGHSPQSYRQERRLYHAAGLLETTDWPVNQIAAASGFSHATGFYRAFQAYFGRSPAEFRKNQHSLRRN